MVYRTLSSLNVGFLGSSERPLQLPGFTALWVRFPQVANLLFLGPWFFFTPISNLIKSVVCVRDEMLHVVSFSPVRAWVLAMEDRRCFECSLNL